jgi:hypothetical protein
MPNYCSNTVRICANEDTVKKLLNAELSFEVLLPRPQEEEDWYEWNMKHWGTKWDRTDFEVKAQGLKGFEARFTTAWAPPVAFLKTLCTKHHDMWMKCDWIEEGGYAGVFIMHWDEEKGEVNTKSLEWNDWCMEEWADRFGQ